jgi:hypothetical protein
MGLINDIRNTRRRVRSKAELLRSLKDAPLAGDMNRSMSLGQADARGRSGPEAAAGTGQRYNPDQFWVDGDGKLNIRVRDLQREIEDLPDDGLGAGAAIKRFPIFLQRDYVATQEEFIARGTTGILQFCAIPRFNNTNAEECFYSGIFPKGWPVADFRIGVVGLFDNGTASSVTLECQFMNTAPGTAMTKTADATVSFTFDLTGLTAGDFIFQDFVIPSSAFTADTRSFWLRFVATAFGTGGPDVALVNLYGERD